jgi:hypothetical protein
MSNGIEIPLEAYIIEMIIGHIYSAGMSAAQINEPASTCEYVTLSLHMSVIPVTGRTLTHDPPMWGSCDR